MIDRIISKTSAYLSETHHYKHLLSILIILCISSILMISAANFEGQFKWDGSVYSALVHKYLLTNELTSLGPSDMPSWTQGIPIQSYLNRFAYYWAAKLLTVVFSLTDKSLFLMLDFIPFTLASIFFYFTCYRYLSLSLTASLFAALWLLLLPPARVIYEIVAHPEALCLMFMSAAMYFSLGQKHLMAAVLLLLGILTRESVVILVVFLMCHHLLSTPLREVTLRRHLPLALYLLAIIIGLGLPFYVQKSSSLSSFSYAPLVLEVNRHFAFAYLLNNFSILWIPYLIGFIHLDWRAQCSHLVVLALGVFLLIAALDWWRVLYGNIYFVVIPLAALTIQRFFKQQALYVFLFVSFIFTTFPSHINFEKLKEPDWWPYYAVLFLFFIQNQISGQRRELVNAHSFP
jgi:hypothetical protein